MCSAKLYGKKGGSLAEDAAAELFVPGPFDTVYLLGALAAMRSVGREPRELIVWCEPQWGVYGVRLFKDGEWMYEVLDDFLPMGEHGPACSFTSSEGKNHDWVPLLEKAYAKVHGSYEAIACGSEAEALEDVVGSGTSRVDMRDFPIWGELWQHLRSKRRRGYAQLAIRRIEPPGEALTSGLISCFGYPLLRLELIEGEMLCELENPWAAGSWSGRWGEGSAELCSASLHYANTLEVPRRGCRTFWMSIQDFCKHFTDIWEARDVSAYWQSAAVTCSTERPSYPLISVSAATQALFVLTQSDRRWSQCDGYESAIGLRVYRCRVVAPPRNAVGVRQNVSSPFRNLELLAARAPAKAHSVVVEVARLEPSCLYIAAADSEYQNAYLVLRVLTACAPRFRELSAPESSYLLQAQAAAPEAEHDGSFSSQDDSREGRSPERNLDYSDMRAAEGWRGFDEGERESIRMPRVLQACMGGCSGLLQC